MKNNIKYWETKDGEKIAYKDLKDDHLLNILKWIKRRAEDGVTVTTGGGNWFDAESNDFWYEEYKIKGDEVLEKYDYEGLLSEARKRKIKW